MANNRDNSNALAEQEAIVNAIGEDTQCVSITTAMPIGAVLLAFNQIAKQYGRTEMSPQEWAELAISTGLTAIKRSWKYSADTQSRKDYVEEMRAIKKLFTVPDSTHPMYLQRMTARFEAEQNCAAKYGVQ
jgi:hypothetical protein